MEHETRQQLLTIGELAQALKVKKSWIYGQTRQRGPKSIPRVRVGKYLRFYLPAVMEWLERNHAEGGFSA